MNKFDGNLAWKQASAAVKANRDLLLALAGVLFFLPSFALIMLFKQPQVPPGATPAQILPLMQDFLTTMAPWFLIGSVVQALGQLALVELLGRGGRPTVGDALRAALAALPSFIAVQLIIGFVMMAILVLAMTLGGLVAPVLGAALGVYLVVQAFARLITASAVIVLERQRNPFVALMRALTLSRGNGFRIGNFLFLVAIAAALVLMVVSVVIGILAALTIGEGRVADIVTGFVSSSASALALTYFVAIVVAMHRQLAGGTPTAAEASEGE